MALRVSQVAIQVLRSSRDNPGRMVSATTTLVMAGAGTGVNPIRHVSAMSSLSLLASPQGGGVPLG